MLQLMSHTYVKQDSYIIHMSDNCQSYRRHAHNALSSHLAATSVHAKLLPVIMEMGKKLPVLSIRVDWALQHMHGSPQRRVITRCACKSQTLCRSEQGTAQTIGQLQIRSLVELVQAGTLSLV